MQLNQAMGDNLAIKWLDPVAGYMTEKSCLGLVLGSLGAVKNQVGEE